ncbi:CDP-diacylglycerol--glycerol-3-phosphate 3-phosphatidyltransferase [Alcanivorax sp. S71-1-4]|jgi:CDP-diacylglycerol--glycerol-3-phosphate 3-phosphatidyltransferase|uniref:CDP-diacylglycerol--glycerol-3-phosphate 3-phosphatidyltransferase n=1 Tax=Alcanivorax sp. S71-1-4 TaxID=1177159 RepID=UPI00135B14AC|nr:CDP-diacylglycerol--glycerol-3-phosphate 3-phosphatidyltransferase [Alcanivorax sp. S71-1-4]KAF0810458.1 CDP-diacylglycerol--glycerol-3-phosphate 3-phosphatidyltransferase [Alcanivorax sp. S71-1-4]
MPDNHNAPPSLNLPNLMTLARLLSIPVFVGAFYLPLSWSGWLAAGIFLVAGITDWLDGYLARRMQLTSRFGAFLDPVADKLMVAAALVLLVQNHGTAWMAIPALVIISREIAVSALREWMAEIGQRARVAVSWVGKVKTVVQIIAITALLVQTPGKTKAGDLLMTWDLWVSYTLLYVATVLTLMSMMSYLRAAWPELWPGRKG